MNPFSVSRRLFERMARPWTMVVLVGAMVVLAVVVGTVLPDDQLRSLANGKPIPDLQVLRNPTSLLDQIDAYGPTGRRLYLTRNSLVDLLIPIIQLLFFGVGLRLTYRGRPRLERAWPVVAALPMVALIGDYGENVGFAILMGAHPLRWWWLSAATTLFTFIKATGSALSAAALLAGLVMRRSHGRGSGRPRSPVPAGQSPTMPMSTQARSSG